MAGKILQSVYQRVLAEDFKLLGPSLQFSHGNENYVKATGIIDVEYGKGFLVNWMNNMAKMPPKGSQQKVILTVERKMEEEIWTRDFGGKIFKTIQFEKNGFMYEKSGVAALRFKLKVKDNSIVFDQQRTIFFGLPAPDLFGLHTTAHSIESDNGWKVDVEVRSPLLGLMLKYTGEVYIEK